MRLEQLILNGFDGVAQLLNHVKVIVDEVVEEPPQQIRHPGRSQVGVVVPARLDLLDVDEVVLADGHDRLRCDERR